MNLGDKLSAIANSEYIKFASSMNAQNVDASIALVILDLMRSKVLEQIYKENLANEQLKSIDEDK